MVAVNKRDRWDSSSEDEQDNRREAQQRHQSKQVPQKQKTKNPKSEATILMPLEPQDDGNGPIVDDETFTQLYRQHNPLLEGCRSVYDTYERIGRVSEGTYGVVWKARDLATNDIVALKQIKFDYDNNENGGHKEGFPIVALREISVLLALSHESVVTVKEMVIGDSFDKVFMVMEYMEFDLKEGLTKFDGSLSQSELKGILKQILNGIHHMHGKWLLHRDLKTSNILVHKSGRVALCDFGLARRYNNPPKCMTQLVVTLWYRSPELLFGENKYGPAIDMWSIGCIFGELICKDAILQGRGELDQLDKIFELLGEIPNETNWPSFDKLPNAALFRWRPKRHDQCTTLEKKFPVNAPVSANQAYLDTNGFNLLKQLLTLDPSKRITASQALQHPYFHQGVQPSTPRFFADSS